MNYLKISTTIMHPDLYGGKDCNEATPRWRGSFYEQEHQDLESISFDPKSFPAGTKITIEVPSCPKGSMEQELCVCGFNWKAWIDQEFS